MGSPEHPVMTVDEHPEAGYLICPYPYGRYLVSADGRSIHCAPPSVGWWYWQRLLIGQALPAAAALRGYELLHASAVALGERVIAFAGYPGMGKSSLALRLMLRGATLVAEDVLTLGESNGRLLAEPGSAMVNLRESEFDQIEADALAGLGHVVGRSEDKVHVIVPTEARALPLVALYLLERGDDTERTFDPVSTPSMTDLLANSFVNYIWRADRQVRQLDLNALLARTVPVFRLRIRPKDGAAELAGKVHAHVNDLP
jgi:serine kinase of HPr protein (carbohydrate metabolism regulator)